MEGAPGPTSGQSEGCARVLRIAHDTLYALEPSPRALEKGRIAVAESPRSP